MIVVRRQELPEIIKRAIFVDAAVRPLLGCVRLELPGACNFEASDNSLHGGPMSQGAALRALRLRDRPSHDQHAQQRPRQDLKVQLLHVLPAKRLIVFEVCPPHLYRHRAQHVHIAAPRRRLQSGVDARERDEGRLADELVGHAPRVLRGTMALGAGKPVLHDQDAQERVDNARSRGPTSMAVRLVDVRVRLLDARITDAPRSQQVGERTHRAVVLGQQQQAQQARPLGPQYGLEQHPAQAQEIAALLSRVLEHILPKSVGLAQASIDRATEPPQAKAAGADADEVARKHDPALGVDILHLDDLHDLAHELIVLEGGRPIKQQQFLLKRLPLARACGFLVAHVCLRFAGVWCEHT
mmetsp:Transcript_115828/g.334501  ORF Transcript_115828/g.334501 Transcript_115828/m.334501 type:complete len:355 (+) Transcript_115828:443-1507(+)